jgi:hypothetical protein
MAFQWAAKLAVMMVDALVETTAWKVVLIALRQSAADTTSPNSNIHRMQIHKKGRSDKTAHEEQPSCSYCASFLRRHCLEPVHERISCAPAGRNTHSYWWPYCTTSIVDQSHCLETEDDSSKHRNLLTCHVFSPGAGTSLLPVTSP